MTNQTINISEENLNFTPSTFDKMKGIATGAFYFVAVALPIISVPGVASAVTGTPAQGFELIMGVAVALGTTMGAIAGKNATRNSALKNGRVELKI